MKADKYYGEVASDYDRARQASARWTNEIEAVDEFVTQGPVLDIPLGTGRFVASYLNKGLDCIGVDVSGDMIAEALKKHPGLDARQGSILDIPFKDQAFGTAVCIRMLDWLTPDQMAQAVAELKRVAREIVVSLRYGEPEIRVNQTHDLAHFMAQLDGLFIAARRETETTCDGVEEIFHLRPAEWSDVLRQFEHHGAAPEREFQRLAEEWFGDVDVSALEVRAEHWTAERLWSVIADMGALYDGDIEDPDNRYITSLKPRFSGNAVTLMERDGDLVVLDGRRRINAWRGEPGLFPVLLCR